MSTQQKEVFSPLVLIQRGHTVPFFCVHGAGGNVLNFRDIARRLGDDRTFYGLQAQGVDGSAPLKSIEEMASLYLPELLRVHPHGPYLLGGYSGGGNIAYEMAQRLIRSGRKVALLVLLDTFRAGIKPVRLTPKGHLKLLFEDGPSYLWERAEARIARFRWEFSNELKIRFYTRQGHPLPIELRELVMTRQFWEATDRYVPEPYSGRVTLYRAAEVAPIFNHAGQNLGWDDLISDLEVVEVPGNHDSLVYEPNVNVMTSHLRNALKAAITH